MQSLFFILFNTDSLLYSSFSWRLKRFFLEIGIIYIFATWSWIFSFGILCLSTTLRCYSLFGILSIEYFLFLLRHRSIFIKNSLKLSLIIAIFLIYYLQFVQLRLHISLSHLWLCVEWLVSLKCIWTFC